MRNIIAALFLLPLSALAQDNRTQYPPLLSNSFFNVNVGYINYPFTNAHLERGFQASAIDVPHAAIRVNLLGHQFNPYFSVQASYMRPVKFVQYKDVNGDGKDHSVWMDFGTLTAKGQVPVYKKLWAYAEAGLGIVSRKGFKINGIAAMQSLNYSTLLLGGGLQYRFNNKWDLIVGTSYLPAKPKYNQPYSIYHSIGFVYTMRPRPAEVVKADAASGYIFPQNLVQVGYCTNQFGYGANNFLSKKIPIFWGGGVQIKDGFYVHYQRNVFHTGKLFSFDVGSAVSFWQTAKNSQRFYTLSVYPLFRFTVLHTKPLDYYLFYSVAGPSYISQTELDDEPTGRHFTFQDFMGMGLYAGRGRHFNAELNINHYSNGNIFTENAGVKIPLTFSVGYAF